MSKPTAVPVPMYMVNTRAELERAIDEIATKFEWTELRQEQALELAMELFLAGETLH